MLTGYDTLVPLMNGAEHRRATAHALPAPPAEEHILTAYTPQVQAPDMEAILRLALEILPSRLYFTSLSYHPQSAPGVRFFTVDYDLAYDSYFADFGPLNIAQLIRFCRALRGHLDNGQDKIVFYSSHDTHLRANAGYLIAGFAVLVLGRPPGDIASLMQTIYPPLLPFRDASFGVATFQLTTHDIVAALAKAKALGWIDVDTFDVADYERHDLLRNGDMNWIVPGKLLAFSSPIDAVPGREAHRLVPLFRQRGVRVVVRLNEKLYDRRAFVEVGIRHVELPFPDGSTPSDLVVRQFLQTCENLSSGAIAVHCKAGLGRTGTLAGVFVMKHYGFSAREFIAWSRMCRPGSVIGNQQHYLLAMQRRLEAAGNQHRKLCVEADVSRGLEPKSRPSSPDRRVVPRPVALVEHLPFECPGETARKTITKLRAALDDEPSVALSRRDATRPFTAPDASLADVVSSTTVPGVFRNTMRGSELSSTGLLFGRALPLGSSHRRKKNMLIPIAKTFVAGVTPGSMEDFIQQ